MPENDDTQDTKGAESETKETDTQVTEGSSEKSDKGQSNDSEGTKETELFELPDGRKVDAKTLSHEWKENFYPEFSRRSNKLSEFEKAAKDAGNAAASEARDQVNKSELLKNVPPDVREAIIQIVAPVIQETFKQRDEQMAQGERQKQFDAELKTLESKYPGKDGLPKFDRNDVLAAMRDSSNRVYDPETKFRQLHEKEFMDVTIKEALKKQAGGNATEETGSSADRKPDKKTPKTFDEAGKSFLERLSAE